MPLALAPFADLGLTPAGLKRLIADHQSAVLPRLRMLWDYWRNPLDLSSEPHARARGGYRLAQERGLPDRLFSTGTLTPVGGGAADRLSRGRPASEIVVENDIGWRVQAMIDYLFGKPVRFQSAVADEDRAAQIERVVEAVWEASGGMALLQDIALIGHVYGYVDLLVRWVGEPADPERDAEFAEPLDQPADLADAASRVRIEIVEPSRGVPIISPDDYRRLDGYVIRVRRRQGPGAEAYSTLTEIFSGSWRQVYEGDELVEGSARLVEQEPNPVSPGRVPVVHIQNLSQPLRYEGLSEVEPLIPLQDELNTRLSDRASRVTLQSFKMLLAKGIDGFDKVPVRPGTVWQTDNLNASIETFGGDSAAPSEEAHVAQVREALDKISGVPPLATGVVQAKVGNLTSENALRLTLQGLLTKTSRKRLTYGRGLQEATALALAALSEQGVFITQPAERAVRVIQPDPLPRSEQDEVREAAAKRDLGVPQERVLQDLGLAPTTGQIG